MLRADQIERGETWINKHQNFRTGRPGRGVGRRPPTDTPSPPVDIQSAEPPELIGRSCGGHRQRTCQQCMTTIHRIFLSYEGGME